LTGGGVKTITITLAGGVIQDVAGVPDNVRVLVKDFDVDGVPRENLTENTNGSFSYDVTWLPGKFWEGIFNGLES